MECDKVFDHIITNDTVSITKFKNYGYMKKISIDTDVFSGIIPVRSSPEDRVIIYNLGLAMYDIYFAYRIYEMYSKIQG